MTGLIPARRPTWLRESLALLRTCWRPVLAINVVTELAAVLAVGALLLPNRGRAASGFSGPDETVTVAVLYVLPAVLVAACTAWSWAAVVQVFRGAGEGRRVRSGEALRRGVRQSGPLTLWLAGVGLIRAAGSVFLFHSVMSYPHAVLGFHPTSLMLVAGGWYLTFATALLPLVVLYERRGAGRAWRLAHSRAATVGQIIAVLVFGLLLDDLAQSVTPRLTQFEGGHGAPLVVRTAVDSAVSVLTSTVAMTALAVAYLRRVALPAASGPEPDAAEPVVIEPERT